ncbi:MAG TPA: ribose ABC transporter permease [Clostridia bacterium]|nr:ribose ABC transporter permease [Clostridia bacterium]
MEIKSGSIKRNDILKLVLQQRILLVLIALCTVITIFIPPFLTVENLLNVARQISINGIVAVGMTFVIITGGIDISVGSTVALGGVISGLAIKQGMPVELAILAALLAGGIVGAFNGALISYFRILPFIATLGTMNLIRGLTLAVCNGQAIWGLPPKFLYLGTGYLSWIPVPVIISLVIFIIGHFLLKDFSIGRYTIAVGGNEEAARLSGVSVKKVKMFAYILCGILSSASGIILAGRLGTAQPNAGMGYELIAIAAVVIGGTSLLGGKGTMAGTLLGALILGVVSNSLNLLGVSSFYQTMITGGIVIIAVLVDMMKKES